LFKGLMLSSMLFHSVRNHYNDSFVYNKQTIIVVIIHFITEEYSVVTAETSDLIPRHTFDYFLFCDLLRDLLRVLLRLLPEK